MDTVLIVDDEVDLRDILALRFSHKGYNVLTAANGKEALELVKNHQVDVIVSDIQMPGGNGVELLDEVKKISPILPLVLFITGFTDLSVEEAFDKGAEAIFSKPFNAADLLKAVAQAIAENKEAKLNDRSVRIPSKLRIEGKFPQFEIAHEAEVSNLGRGGFFLGLETQFPKVNEEVSFKIHVNQEKGISVQGKGIVKWVRTNKTPELQSGCGIQFLKFEGTEKSKLFEFINFLKTKQYIPKN